jgi:ATP-binding cassette subfamily B (MDR/TAP) protein 9
MSNEEDDRNNHDESSFFNHYEGDLGHAADDPALFHVSDNGPDTDETDDTDLSRANEIWKVKLLLGGILLLDAILSLLLFFPWPWVKAPENLPNHYQFYGSLIDMGVLAMLRVLACAVAILVAYLKAEVPREYPFEVFRSNGERKTQLELEQEALEEPFASWFHRYIRRPAFVAEVVAVSTQIVGIAKCLVRMNLEMGILQDAEPFHPIFWIAILITAIFSALEACYLDGLCKIAAAYGKAVRGGRRTAPTILHSISAQLLAPLLDATDEEEPQASSSPPFESFHESDEEHENARAVPDITSDTEYKAGWKDLIMMCAPDLHMIACAFVFLLLAAIAQVYIPKYLGNILDSLAEAFSGGGDDDSKNRKIDIREVPGFMVNMKKLVWASIAAGVFAGFRGSIFTVVGARVNVRLRVKLMDALLSQDIGFFDVTKTGDITSRLSSDTTLVGDQVSLNVNVFLRSLVQALGVLLFMFLVSWQLSILAFISVPLVTLLSKWYGEYVRSLTKLMQQKLADGNSVSEAALGSMATVRAFDAGEIELSAFEDSMSKYLQLNNKAALAYCGYATMSTSCPQLVFAIVVFYGGMLVRNGDMTSGQLVSFLLYLQSLSDAFATIGWVFSSLTQAVGAADKVFELMHRNPRMTCPAETDGPEHATSHRGILGIEATKTRRQRMYGRRPENARGEIVLENVEMYYPARPKRRVLDGLSLKIYPGSVVALVGPSGGGKSSVMSLIQHLYEQSSGRVLFDGMEVHEICPAWLSRNVSIVSQEPTLFARSIKKNIMYGLEGTDSEPSDEEIVEAAKLANADSFIQQMPQKYETEVGERGVALSGGQKQR